MNNINIKIKVTTADEIVEVVIGNIYVHCEIKFDELIPAQSVRAKVAINTLQAELNHIAYNISARVSDEVSKTILKFTEEYH